MSPKPVRIALSAFVLAVTWAALDLLGASLLNEAAILDWLTDKAWIAFLRPDIRDLVVEHGWQPVVALLVAAATFRHLAPLANHIEARFFAGAPPFLYTPSRSADERLDFRAKHHRLVGREAELRLLGDFMTCDGTFLWWWLLGPAGSGKSRLALEWAARLEGCDAGFLARSVELDALKMWTPRRPTLIVIDDAAEQPGFILEALELLGARAHGFAHPVRVLLVDRSIPESLNQAEIQSRYTDYRHKHKPFLVSPLGEEHIASLASDIAAAGATAAELMPEQRERLMRISAGRPLILILAIESFLEHGDLKWQTQEEIIREQVERLAANFSRQGIDPGALPVLALASFTRGLPWDAAARFAAEAPLPSKALLDSVYGQDTADAIPAIQPDLLGEYFVLQQFANLNRPERERFVKAAWEADPQAVPLTLLLLISDFPSHPSLVDLQRPSGDEAAEGLAAAYVGLIHMACRGDDESSWSDIRPYWKALAALAEAHPRLRKVSEAIGVSARTATDFFRVHREKEGVDEVVAVTADLAHRFPDNDWIRNGRYESLAKAIIFYGESAMWEPLSSSLQILREQASTSPGDEKAQVVFARGLVAAALVHSLHDKVPDAGKLLLEFADVYDRASDNRDMQEIYGHAEKLLNVLHGSTA